MTEANPQGADLQSAADRIGGLIDSKPEPQKEEVATPTETEKPAEPVKAEGEQEQSQDSSETQEAETQEQQEHPEFNSIQELAEALEIPLEDFLGKIKGKVKVNGVEQEVTLADMRNGYQMESDYRRKTAELAEHRKAFDAERERIASEVNRQFTEAQALTGVLEQQLTAEFNAVDWNHLRATDPAEFAAKRQEYNERYAQIQGIKSNVNATLAQQAEQMQRKQAEELKEILNQEKERLAAAIPEFRDQAKSEPLRTEIKNFLKSNGFSDQDIGSVYDHRQVLIIRDAMEYRKLKAKGVEVKNKVVIAPKLQKPGNSDSKGTAANANLRERLARLKKTGRVEDAAELIKL